MEIQQQIRFIVEEYDAMMTCLRNTVCARSKSKPTSWYERKRKLGLLRHDLTKDLVKTSSGNPVVYKYDGDFPDAFVGIQDIKLCGSRVWLHGFSDDCVLERLWANPMFYLSKIPPESGMTTPDFSMTLDMEEVEMKMNLNLNLFRRNALSQIAQNMGINVIPGLNWGGYKSLDFAFDGIESGGIYAISNIGVNVDYMSRKMFRVGFLEAVRVSHPKGLVLYGYPMEDYCGVETRVYPNENIKRLRKLKRRRS